MFKIVQNSEFGTIGNSNGTSSYISCHLTYKNGTNEPDIPEMARIVMDSE